jgi:phage shock protein A
MQAIERIRTGLRAHPLLAIALVVGLALVSLPVAGVLLLVAAAVAFAPLVERARPMQARAEDAVMAMRRQAMTVVQTVSSSMADAMMLERAAEREAFQSRSWAARAEKAMLKGDDAEARRCIERKQGHDHARAELLGELERQRAAVAKLKPQVEVMRAGVETAARAGELLAVRSRRAAATREVVMTASGLETRAGAAAFERLAADVARQEAEAAAIEELIGTPGSDEHAQTWDKIERDERVEAEVADLRQRVGLKRPALAGKSG